MTYKEKLLDPRWQKKRLEIFERDKWMCVACCNTKETLHLHHMMYEDCQPWDNYDLTLVTVCKSCHEKLHSKDKKIRIETYTFLFFQIWIKEEIKKEINAEN